MSIRKLLFHLACFIIVIISSIDIYWLSKNSEVIYEYEQNPIGLYLLERDKGDVSLFISCKSLGTYVVIMSLYILWHYRKSYIGIITFVLITIQIILLIYLSTPYRYWSFIF